MKPARRWAREPRTPPRGREARTSTVKTVLAVVLFVLGGVAVVFSLYGMWFHLTIRTEGTVPGSSWG